MRTGVLSRLGWTASPLSYSAALLLAGLCGLLASGALGFLVWQKQSDDWEQEFIIGALQRQHVVQNTLEEVVRSLDHVGRFVESSDQVTAEEFDYYNTLMLDRFLGVSWIQPLPVSSPLPAAWHDIQPGCTPVDSGWHYPISLISAREPVSASIGLDLRCDPVRVGVMQQARDLGQVMATPHVTRLVHSGRNMVLFRPVYARQQLDSVTVRRQALRGFIVAGADVGMLVAAQLSALDGDARYVMTLVDVDAATGEQTFLLRTHAQLPQPDVERRHLDLSFAGRQLYMLLAPTQAFWKLRHDHTAWLVGGGGLCFTLLFMAWLRSQHKRRIQAEQLAIARNDDLIDREARLAALFQHSPIAILRCDARGLIMDANPAAARLLGSSVSALYGTRFVQHLSDWSADAFQRRWQEAAWLELEVSDPGGEGIPVLVRALSMRQPDGTPYAWTMLEDLRAIRHNERLKREFLATISHELRTPLTAIKGAVELVRTGAMGECPPDANALLGMAVQNADALNKLINDLLDAERLALGKLSLEMRRQHVLPLLERACQEAAPLLGEKCLAWDMHVADGGAEADVDGERLIQVFKNLFSNAVKFSPLNGRIMVSLSRGAGGTILIRVQDEGSGIPPDFMLRMFKPFNQADGSDRRATGGTGLGLAISHGLMERMGGRLYAEQLSGQGATFIVELPDAACETHPGSGESGHAAV